MTSACQCGSSETKPPETVRPTQVPAVDEQRTSSGEPKVTETEGKALLDKWLASQNSQDFATYATLYAQKFEGIKRSGERTARFDRARWLKDRKGMFGSPTRVQAKDIRFMPRGRELVAIFEQEWSSRTFADKGRKELVLMREGNELRITREEMLRSELAPPVGASASAGAAMLVVQAGGLRAVLGRAAEKASEPSGLDLFEKGPGWTAVSQDPPNVARLHVSNAMAVDVLTTDGTHCAGTMAAPREFVNVVSYQVDSSESEDVPEVKEPTSVEKAQNAWSIAHEHWIGATFTLTAPASCAGDPVLARDASLPRANIARPIDATSLTQRAIQLARESDAYQEAQRRYEERGRSGPWEEYSSMIAQAFRFENESRVLVSVTIPMVSCSDVGEGLWVVYSFDPSHSTEPPRVIVGPIRNAPGSVQAVLDVEGDGELEFLVHDDQNIETALMSARGATLRAWWIDWQDCAC